MGISYQLTFSPPQENVWLQWFPFVSFSVNSDTTVVQLQDGSKEIRVNNKYKCSDFSLIISEKAFWVLE